MVSGGVGAGCLVGRLGGWEVGRLGGWEVGGPKSAPAGNSPEAKEKVHPTKRKLKKTNQPSI